MADIETGLEFRPLRPLGGAIRVAKAYAVEQPFLLVFVTPSTYSLSWTGSIAFDTLLKEALIKFPGSLVAEGTVTPATLPAYLRTTFIVAFDPSDPESETEVIRFDQLHEAARVPPDRILFCRFDVGWHDREGVKIQKAGPWGHETTYSLTADNPHYYPDSSSLGIKLERSRPVTRQLWNWIVTHASLGSLLRTRIDASIAVAQLNEFVGEPEFGAPTPEQPPLPPIPQAGE